jgi:tetratricopeptide (TPR) repeat protein
VDDALAGLDRYGLLEPAASGTVVLHPLVRETSAAFLAGEADVDEWRERVEDRVVAFVGETVAREKDGWDDARLLVPHVLALTELTNGGAGARFTAHRNAADALAGQVTAAGAYGLEIEVRQGVLDAELRVLGDDARDVVVSRLNVGWALQRGSDLPGAENQLRRALTTASSRYPDLVTPARHDLGFTLARLGRLDEAVDQLESARAARLTEDGPDHLETLSATGNLATALSNRGDHRRAADLHRETLAALIRTVGPDHPAALVGMNQLGIALSGLGDHRAAAELDAEAAERYERLLGPDHPDTLAGRHNLAWTCTTWGTPRQRPGSPGRRSPAGRPSSARTTRTR